MNEDALSGLPWRQPMLMIDRLVSCVPHESIETLKMVTSVDAMLRAVEAGSPSEVSEAATHLSNGSGKKTSLALALPPAMVLEGMSQSAALLFQKSYGALGEAGALPVLGYVRAEHASFAGPGDTIHFRVRARKMTRSAGLFEASAHVEEWVIAKAEFAMAIASEDQAGPDSLTAPKTSHDEPSEDDVP